ncbi:MAG: DNA mismatch repair protein MutS [Treponema sp.]|jgi:DNA mismatch repair protein MutS|nr:DNA mismatch repair protein MutS [Treponema sp.]
MRDQYQRIKHDHPGEVLFFRLGDFYEMFAGDALEISALLGLTLTSRNGLPMCGIPCHAARTYIAKLLRHGKKVAICEQVSEPGKGLIERRVVEVVTPGTALDEDYLDKGSANYLGSLALYRDVMGLACIDISSGDFRATSFPRDSAGRLRQEFERLQIRELIVQESLLEEKGGVARAILERPNLVLNRWADWLFDRDRSRERLCRQFKVSNLRSFGLEDDSVELLAAGALLDYLDDTAKSTIPHVRSIVVYRESEYAGIDESTQRNLELTRNLHDGDSRYSLLEVMDESKTSMGRRLLKWRILHPLQDTAVIEDRLNMVEALYRDQGRLGALRDLLSRTPDLERLSGRVAMDRAHGKDMLAVKNALDSLNTALTVIENLPLPFESPPARSLRPRQEAGPGGSAPPGPEPLPTGAEPNSGNDRETPTGLMRLLELGDLLARALAEDPSILLTEGNLIRDGYDEELDELRQLRDNGRQLLEEYLEEERQQTGIPGLKIRYNRIIGYYMEVSKAHLSRVPAHFIRRQGIAGAERFTSNRLSSLESDINGAQDRIISLEKDLFLFLRTQAQDRLEDLFAAAMLLAELDIAQSLARAATLRRWVRPCLSSGADLMILEGRHPVVEAHLPPGEFIPNDVILDCPPENNFSFALITGPNMAGKSTYLRAAALVVLMAQTGSFVPAREARIGIADRIYCRVGASDNLARGESTFLSEMSETAYILNTATERSLVIMDEVGRGTGIKDGLSIAWAVCEDLLDRVKCRTLFATHYHELSRIAHPRLVNRSMEILDKDGEILFLRRLKEGPSGESYGLHVARLGGIPEPVLHRARAIVENRVPVAVQFTVPPADEAPGADETAPSGPAAPADGSSWSSIPPQLLFLAQEIRLLDLNTTTPLETLNRVKAWQELLTGISGIDETLSFKRSRKEKPSAYPEGPSLFDLN